jgi:hypothetical protein
MWACARLLYKLQPSHLPLKHSSKCCVSNDLYGLWGVQDRNANVILQLAPSYLAGNFLTFTFSEFVFLDQNFSQLKERLLLTYYFDLFVEKNKRIELNDIH